VVRIAFRTFYPWGKNSRYSFNRNVVETQRRTSEKRQRFAIRIFRVPTQAMSIRTVEISSFVCLYSACPPVPCNNACTHSMSINFIYTSLLVLCHLSVSCIYHRVFKRQKSWGLLGRRCIRSCFDVHWCLHFVFPPLLSSPHYTRTGYKHCTR